MWTTHHESFRSREIVEALGGCTSFSYKNIELLEGGCVLRYHIESENQFWRTANSEIVKTRAHLTCLFSELWTISYCKSVATYKDLMIFEKGIFSFNRCLILLLSIPNACSTIDCYENSNGDIKQEESETPATNGDGSRHTEEKHQVKKTIENLSKQYNGSENGECDDNESDSTYEVDGPLLADSLVPFNLTAPSPMPAYLSVHYICESASRLLFLSVHWARNIPTFQCLSQETQVSLVRGCWSELFTLGMAQCNHIMSLNTILTAIVSHLTQAVATEKLSRSRFRQVLDHITRLQDFVSSMSKLQPDEHEYAYLKTIVLFQCENVSESKRNQIERLQERAAQELRHHVEDAYADMPERFTRLLLKLPPLRALQPQ
ncbi:Nuclear receptor subfamily 2 group C member 2, partial [Halocaridina rubra]